MLGAVACGWGALNSGEAEADLVVQNINQTVSGGILELDLNLDSVNDFRIDDKGSSSFIFSLDNKLNQVFRTAPPGGDEQALVFSPGETVDGAQGTPFEFARMFGNVGDTLGTLAQQVSLAFNWILAEISITAGCKSLMAVRLSAWQVSRMWLDSVLLRSLNHRASHTSPSSQAGAAGLAALRWQKKRQSSGESAENGSNGTSA